MRYEIVRLSQKLAEKYTNAFVLDISKRFTPRTRQSILQDLALSMERRPIAKKRQKITKSHPKGIG